MSNYVVIYSIKKKKKKPYMVVKPFIITILSYYTEVYSLTGYTLFYLSFNLILETNMWGRWNYNYLNFKGQKKGDSKVLRIMLNANELNPIWIRSSNYIRAFILTIYFANICFNILNRYLYLKPIQELLHYFYPAHICFFGINYNGDQLIGFTSAIPYILSKVNLTIMLI